MSTATQFDVVQFDDALVDAVSARVHRMRVAATRARATVRRAAPKVGSAATLAAGGVAMVVLVGGPFFSR